jgi:hypothetical protein
VTRRERAEQGHLVTLLGPGGATRSVSVVSVGSVRLGPPRPDSDRLEPSQTFLMAETSNSRVTVSPTRTPPASSAAFHVMP